MEFDLSRLPKEVREQVDKIFREDFDLKALEAMRRQRAIAKRNHDSKLRAMNGFGGKTMEIDSFVDTIWRRVYGHNYTEDKDLLAFLKKRNPEIVVKAGGTKEIMAGWVPSMESAGKRWRKVY